MIESRFVVCSLRLCQPRPSNCHLRLRAIFSMAPKRKQAANVESEFTAPEPKPKKPKAVKLTEPQTDEQGWTAHPPSLIYKFKKPAAAASKIAAFDLDGTLVLVKSGAQFARGPDDWKFFNGAVVDTVRRFHEDGYKVVIFTNQGGIKSALTGPGAVSFKGRLDQVVKALGVSAQVFAATQKDDLRKPERGMWDFFVEHGNAGVKPELDSCFFVGDAAGRDGDIADSDKGFAANVGIAFKTPQEAFGDKGSGGGGPNAGLVSIFDQLASRFKDDFWKKQAFSKASAVLTDHPEKVESGKAAMKLKGVGKGCAAVIDEFLTTGTVALLDPAEDAQKAADKKKAAAEKEQTETAYAFL